MSLTPFVLRPVRVTQQDRPREASEVRRCSRCGAASLVCVESWERRVVGVRTGSWILTFECQSCRVEVTLHPHREILIERLFAFLMLPAIFPGLFFFASARRKARAWADNPVISGSSVSFQREPPARVCAACLGVARCSEIGRRQTRGVTLGTRFRYTCSGCASDFTVRDDRSLVFAFVSASVLSSVGTLVVMFPPGSAVGATASNRWFGVAVLGIALATWLTLVGWIRARRAHPLV